jgi:hypothetical protein
MHTYIHTYIYTNKHTYIHTYIHTGTIRLPPHVFEAEEVAVEAPGVGRPAIHHVEERVDHNGAVC